MNNQLPREFIDSLDGLPGLNDKSALIEALESDPVVSVRFNPYKLAEKPLGKQVPWCRYGFLLETRPQFTIDPHFHGGAYYVQEASSMFVEHLVRESIGNDENIKILDLCAAPGGKTTLLSTVAGLEGLVVANEVVRSRANILVGNVQKWGLGNVVVTNNDPTHFSQLKDYFDLVVVDAPCSGEGMFRKNPEARGEWSSENIHICAARQKRILEDVWPSLKPGGVLIYSTCTFNRKENEDNIQWLVSSNDCEAVEIPIIDSWGIHKEKSSNGINTFRFYPGKAEGEGFFCAIIRKAETRSKTRFPKPYRKKLTELTHNDLKEMKRWVSQPGFMHFAAVENNVYGYYANIYRDVKMLAETFTVIYSGVLCGQIYHGILKPEHPLAVFHDLNRDIVEGISIDLEQSLKFLRKQDFDTGILKEGLNLLSHQNLPIGWIRKIGHRANNLYPKEFRIVNL